MPIIRGHHSFDDYFTKIPNDWVRDTRLSFKARGLLTLVMSHSRGWSLSINALAEQNQEGKDAIRSAIAELEALGYLSREQINQGGRFGESIWTTHDPSEPLADLPMAENPTTENPTPKKNNLKEEQVKNNTRDLFDEFWKEYPKAPQHRTERKSDALREFKSALTRAKFEDILAGAIAYANDPKENRYKLIAVKWLRNDGWELATQPNPDTERAKQRRERELQRSNEFLAEIRAQEQNAGPAPKCPHGQNLALCKKCLQ